MQSNKKDPDEKSNINNLKFSKKLEKNIEIVKSIFVDDDTLIERQLVNHYNTDIKCCIFYSDGMVDNKIINQNIIYPFQTTNIDVKKNEVIDILANEILRINDVSKTNDPNKIIQGIVYGDSVLFLDGSCDALILNTKGFTLRSTTEPENEKVLRGPREGFSEGILNNLTMLRRRIRTQDLKMKYLTFGSATKTKACVCYIDNIVNKKILDELYKRLEKFTLDGALDVNYINEIIRDSPRSFFNTIGVTERPDVVAAKLLEGRIAFFLDGTPQVITLPFLFIENFQSNEDYYLNYYYASGARILRIIGFLITLILPALYTAIVTFHHEMLPLPLLLSISAARQSVPFPTIVEVLGMLIVFQILAETGIRMAQGVGQALSIVGALVIGQSAVEAKIVSAPVIIIVALTGITGLLIQRLDASTLILRVLFILSSAFIGIYGLIMMIIALLIHLLNLRSFGVPYFAEFDLLNFQKNKDIIIRAPWWKMVTRPEYITENRTRMKTDRNNNK